MPGWHVATVTEVIVETPRTRTFKLEVPGFGRYRPGQHVDIRLTAPDGYQAQRSYSIASAPGDPDRIEITIELIDDGEVSPYFHEVVQPGDRFELRGPIGGPFTWTVQQGGPLLLVCGGSGIVPLMSMLRHRAAAGGQGVRTALLYSSRTFDEIIYRDELEEMAAQDQDFDLSLALTREQPQHWTGYARRIDADMLREVLDRLGQPAWSYVCGPTGLVETAASSLADLGLPPSSIRTERFGPSGT